MSYDELRCPCPNCSQPSANGYWWVEDTMNVFQPEFIHLEPSPLQYLRYGLKTTLGVNVNTAADSIRALAKEWAK